jgi:hypothetical protein
MTARHDRRPGPPAPTLELRIDEVVLHGFSPGDRYRIGEAIERELHRLLAEGALPDQIEGDVRVDALDGGRFDLPRGARGDQVGALIARAVYGGLRSAIAPAAADAVRGEASGSPGPGMRAPADGASVGGLGAATERGASTTSDGGWR